MQKQIENLLANGYPLIAYGNNEVSKSVKDTNALIKSYSQFENSEQVTKKGETVKTNKGVGIACNQFADEDYILFGLDFDSVQPKQVMREVDFIKSKGWNNCTIGSKSKAGKVLLLTDVENLHKVQSTRKIGKIDILYSNIRANIAGQYNKDRSLNYRPRDGFKSVSEISIYELSYVDDIDELFGELQEMQPEADIKDAVNNRHSALTQKATALLQIKSPIAVRRDLYDSPEFKSISEDNDRKYHETPKQEVERIIESQITFLLKDNESKERLFNLWNNDKVLNIVDSEIKKFDYMPLEKNSLFYLIYKSARSNLNIDDRGLAFYIALNFIGSLVSANYTLDGGSIDTAFIVLLVGLTGSGKSSGIKLHDKLFDEFIKNASAIATHSLTDQMKIASLKNIGITKEEVSSSRRLKELVNNYNVLGLNEDEFTDMFRDTTGREKLRLILRLITDYKGETFKYTTSNEKEVYKIFCHSPSLFGYFGIQPYFAEKFLDDEYYAKGYGNRFLTLVIKGKKKKVFPVFNIDEKTRACLSTMFMSLDFNYSDAIPLKASDVGKYVKEIREKGQGPKKVEEKVYWSKNRGFKRRDMEQEIGVVEWLMDNSDDDLLKEYLSFGVPDNNIHAYFQRAQMSIKGVAMIYAYADRLFNQFENEPVLRVRDLEKAKAFFFNSTQYAFSEQGISEDNIVDDYKEFINFIYPYQKELGYLTKSIVTKKCRRKFKDISARNNWLDSALERGDLKLIKGETLDSYGSRFMINMSMEV